MVRESQGKSGKVRERVRKSQGNGKGKGKGMGKGMGKGITCVASLKAGK